VTPAGIFPYICLRVAKKFTKYLVSVWFVILLVIGNTPMDFIHLFAGHKDSVHAFHKGVVIENKHHHCAFLLLTLASFVNDSQAPAVTLQSRQVHIRRHTSISTYYIQRCIVAVSLRGPPIA
jgi:hypothetical protein